MPVTRNQIVELEKYKALREKLLNEQKRQKTYREKGNDLFILRNTRKKYKDEFPQIQYFSISQSKALFNLNSYYGKILSVQQIIMAYNTLLKVRELDRQLLIEYGKVRDAQSKLEELYGLKETNSQLTRNIASRIINKKEIDNINEKIASLERNLSSIKINNADDLQKKSKEVENARAKMDTALKDMKVLEPARNAILQGQKKAERMINKQLDNRHIKNYEKSRRRSRGR